MNAALDMLRAGLAPFAAGLRSPGALSDPSGMARAKNEVERIHGGAAIVADTRSIVSAVEDFFRTGRVAGLRDLKYLCLGLGVIADPPDRCVLADEGLRKRVIELVEGLPEMRQRIRCFQALLSSYWAFPRNGRQTSAAARAGWCALRSWLRAEHARILASGVPTPPWFAQLTGYAALLTDQPYGDFGAALLRGDFGALRSAMERLAIPLDSWVLEEAVVAQVQAGCESNDAAFNEALPGLISTAAGHGEVKLGASLRLRCVALLLCRYARCREHPEHPALRDAAVAIIGNPWLQRTHWDAHVLDARGKPDEQSREMVNGWLKRCLTRDFFELLSAYGAGDRRRLDYWLRFEPVIEDMWFALGRDAQSRRSEPFREFRSRAKGRLLDLDGTTSNDNNAFVMRVGRHLLVEFGVSGNAMYVYEWAALGQPVLDILHPPGGERTPVNIQLLKDKSRAVQRLTHMDSAAQTWEQKFDADLVPRVGRRPDAPPRRAEPVAHIPLTGTVEQRPRPMPFSPDAWRAFVRTHGLRVADNRDRQGALWVLNARQPSHVTGQLKAWGFRCKDSKGWYKE